MIELLKYIYRAYRYRFKFDPNEINYIIKNLDEGKVAVDIGAHKGGYLYWMRKNVKQNGKVFAFEPQLKLYNYLKQLLELLKFKNVIIENMGISSEEGDVILLIPKNKKGNSPGARIDYIDDGTQYEELKIHTTTLDEYFFNRQLFPDLIKIDVEGHEKQVLLGGINLLKTSKPKIIMECENRHLTEGSIYDVFNILFELGYQGYYFENKKLKSIKEFNVAIHQKVDSGKFWEAKGYINNFIFEK
jgi:FkbM family methyltransferase